MIKLHKFIILLSVLLTSCKFPVLNSVIAEKYNFLPENSGVINAKALQKAIDENDVVYIEKPGIYELSSTVYLDSNTELIFEKGVHLKKTFSGEYYSHVFLNKHAQIEGVFDSNIKISGLSLYINDVDSLNWEYEKQIYGLRGQLAFYNVKEVKIENFSCMDVGKNQFAVHICNFENLEIFECHIEGHKDGIHLGQGQNFVIKNCVFKTHDDAIALNGYDYSTSNPDVGWIQNGKIEDCIDLNDQNPDFANFCRFLAGSWVDWKIGNAYRNGDAVIANGILYRAINISNMESKISTIKPIHRSGIVTHDGIDWLYVAKGRKYSAGVRNVSFSNIILEKPRCGFFFCLENGKYCRSYYPTALIPKQYNISLANINIRHSGYPKLIWIGSPLNELSIRSSVFNNSSILIADTSRGDVQRYGNCHILFSKCLFKGGSHSMLLKNEYSNIFLHLLTEDSSFFESDFSSKVEDVSGRIIVSSDLPGLK